MNEHDLEVGGHRKRNETLHAFFFLYPRRKEYMHNAPFRDAPKKVLARGFAPDIISSGIEGSRYIDSDITSLSLWRTSMSSPLNWITGV